MRENLKSHFEQSPQTAARDGVVAKSEPRGISLLFCRQGDKTEKPQHPCRGSPFPWFHNRYLSLSNGIGVGAGAGLPIVGADITLPVLDTGAPTVGYGFDGALSWAFAGSYWQSQRPWVAFLQPTLARPVTTKAERIKTRRMTIPSVGV